MGLARHRYICMYSTLFPTSWYLHSMLQTITPLAPVYTPCSTVPSPSVQTAFNQGQKMASNFRPAG